MLRAANCYGIRHEGIEKPSFLISAARTLVIVDELTEFLARLYAQLDAAVPKHLARLAFVDLGIDVQRGKDWIKRRRRNVHQERFIEPLVLNVPFLPLDMGIAFVNLRGLRKSGTLLMDRLRRKKSRHLGRKFFQPHGAVIFKKWMKGVIADPRLIPEDVIAEVTYLFEHLAYVVDRPVICCELDTGEAERALRLAALRIGDQRMFRDPHP